jgi:hypothetical protein
MNLLFHVIGCRGLLMGSSGSLPVTECQHSFGFIAAHFFAQHGKGGRVCHCLIQVLPLY